MQTAREVRILSVLSSTFVVLTRSEKSIKSKKCEDRHYPEGTKIFLKKEWLSVNKYAFN